MKKEEIYHKLASLLVSFVGLKKGQNLVIKTEAIHKDVAITIADYAYKSGAKYCKIDFELPQLTKSRILNSEDRLLTYLPRFNQANHDDYIKEDWATIFLKGEEDPELLAKLSSEKRGIIEKTYFDSISSYQKARIDNSISWLIIVLPTPQWSAKVLGLTPNEQAVMQMWEKLIPIYKLDAADPVEAWEGEANSLNDICENLNRSSFKRISFKGPGTDLSVGLSPKANWITTKAKTALGATFYGNLPVEVFTTPDFRKTEGIVTTTRPVMVLNQLVKKAVFEFKNGKMISFNAEEGLEALQELFRIDPTMQNLGEAALIDINSPNYKSGLIFQNILLDEGASSHVALGGGIPPCIEGAEKLSMEEKLAEGINISRFHIDFMIGSDEVDVFGTTDAEEEIKIMDKGQFTRVALDRY